MVKPFFCTGVILTKCNIVILHNYMYVATYDNHISTYCIYLNRSPGVYFLYKIFDMAFKRIWRLFKPRPLFPIVLLSRIEWQVLVLVFMSLIVWLQANTFIKVHGFHSLTKRKGASCRKTTNVKIHCKWPTVATSERRMHTLRDISRIN